MKELSGWSFLGSLSLLVLGCKKLAENRVMYILDQHLME
jgi:hypothetical protein